MTLPATKAACNVMDEQKIGKARQCQSQYVILDNPTEVLVFFCSQAAIIPKQNHPAKTQTAYQTHVQPWETHVLLQTLQHTFCMSAKVYPS